MIDKNYCTAEMEAAAKVFELLKNENGGRNMLYRIKQAFLLASGYDDKFIPYFKLFFNLCNEDELSNVFKLSSLSDGEAIFGKIKNGDDWTYMAFYRSSTDVVFVDIDKQDKYYITAIDSFDHDVIKVPSLYDNLDIDEELCGEYNNETIIPRIDMSLSDMKSKLKYIMAHSFVIKHTDNVNNDFDCYNASVYTDKDINEYFDESNDDKHKFRFIDISSNYIPE